MVPSRSSYISGKDLNPGGLWPRRTRIIVVSDAAVDVDGGLPLTRR